MNSLNKNSYNPHDLQFIDLRLQNGQVELILRAMELYGYNLKFIGLSILFWTIFIRTLFYTQLVLNNSMNYVF